MISELQVICAYNLKYKTNHTNNIIIFIITLHKI